MKYLKCHAGKNSASGAHDWCLLEKSTTDINNNNNNNSAAAAVMNNFYIYNLADFQGVEQKKCQWLYKRVSCEKWMTGEASLLNIKRKVVI